MSKRTIVKSKINDSGKLSYTVFDFPKGKIFLAQSGKGLLAVSFVKDKKDVDRLLAGLTKRFPTTVNEEQPFKKERILFDRYFSGIRTDFSDLTLDFSLGTDYQQRVWKEARKIPYGKTGTYKTLASKLKHMGYRSVGQAMARNPLLIIVPCHRVWRSDGGLGGFSAGLHLKKYLLALERVQDFV